MNVKFKIPYNYVYSDELVEYLENYFELIDSVYFSFTKGSRPIKNLQDNMFYHLKKIEKIKNRLQVKVNFILNSVIPISITDFELFIIESGLIDIITIARDEVYQVVKEYAEKKNLNIAYEASRFYKYIKDNTGVLQENADILTYGFEHELPQQTKDKQLLCFIANERCYDKCEFKIEHNTNVILRNLGLTTTKFSCPYKDKREIYSVEKVHGICEKYQIDLLKLCDRTMSDEELLNVFRIWFPYTKQYLLVNACKER